MKHLETYLPIPAFVGTKIIYFGVNFSSIIEQAIVIVITGLMLRYINKYLDERKRKKNEHLN